MNEFVDSHAHIYLNKFKEDLQDVLERSFEHGVNRIYMPNIDHTSIDDMMELEGKYPANCFSMMGLHPCSVKKGFEKELYIVEEWLGKRDFTAVGEIGTDLYWDKTFWGEQQEAFKVQVEWAKQYKLPIVIHCRESIDETIELVEALKTDDLTGVFHCFSGNLEQAKKIVELGFYLGFGGVATFKNGGLDTVIPHIDLDHFLLETDSPYLAPVPHRGKRNEPAYIPIVAKKIATLQEKPLDEVASKTTANALKLFGHK
ncbi:TatD family hydrolase [Fulvivirga kasyanovii]|uniref:TatD family deoxyribonuclease n=1 Tax=Fulvivirga kasyanovii TaxID=396812 RepID=A0ABW9RYD1_9BACT|nr:TatD family hydrolase [Fulvivirga kasyanovii]MTI28050.1 TatD family deoxyribonuclease [Fulvivirga kasyanovii]